MPETRPPADSIISLAASRVSVGSVPVRTKVRPSRVVPRTLLFREHGQAEFFEPVDQRQVALVLEEVVDGRRDLGADVVDGGQRGDVGGDDVVDVAEVLGQRLRGALADVADAEAEQDAVERRRL